ncbi:MAG: enterocin L50 family leaderless bacteriocin [Lactobacillaceae bacterium]|jgi:hypothetical protein|nr:enterocin L50 family leaderless bacteriocin [Lactobacillaceae bacterium]
MGIVARLALKYGVKYRNKIMNLLGQGWTVSQIESWLKRH